MRMSRKCWVWISIQFVWKQLELTGRHYHQSKRQSGRPKTKRFRKRSRWAHEPERSNIVCSGCQRRGHNIRTCLARAELERQREDAVARAAVSGNAAATATSQESTSGELDLSWNSTKMWQNTFGNEWKWYNPSTIVFYGIIASLTTTTDSSFGQLSLREKNQIRELPTFIGRTLYVASLSHRYAGHSFGDFGITSSKISKGNKV